MKKDKTSGARFGYEGLDRVLHERARLSILTSLYLRPTGHTFNEMKELCGLSDGNLSRHVKLLKEAGLLEVIKGYENNKPLTTLKITKSGKERYAAYIGELEKVLKDANSEKGALKATKVKPETA
jgi:DNA-binding MarR family transcriptional regulator